MSKLTPEQLRAKYGMDNPPDPKNAHVVSMLDGERMVSEMFDWRQDVNELFDPARCPEMHKVAREAHGELRAAMAAGEVEYVDASNNPYDPDDVDDAAMLVHFVGSPGVVVVRPDAVEMFAAMYKNTWQVTVRQAPPTRCAVRVAPVCDSACANGRSLEFWPYLAGQFLLMFPICAACRATASQIAEDGMKLSIMAANEQLEDMPDPAWARTAPWWLRWRAAARRWLKRHT